MHVGIGVNLWGIAGQRPALPSRHGTASGSVTCLLAAFSSPNLADLVASVPSHGAPTRPDNISAWTLRAAPEGQILSE
jgi:hypothetical protein